MISGQPAAGKTTVATIIGKLLKIENIGGGEILKEMASERGYKPTGNDWWDTPDGIKFLKERERNPEFDKEVDIRMEKKIRAGDVVVTSYTAPWLFKFGFKVWLDASVENRTKRMSDRDEMEKSKTNEIVKLRDQENHKLYMSLYKIDFGVDKSPFDMIINTDNKKPEEVADLIIKKYKEKNNI
ncbi:MAG: cytidylate kinase family protein [Candidatus Micrarchaeia archaeon]